MQNAVLMEDSQKLVYLLVSIQSYQVFNWGREAGPGTGGAAAGRCLRLSAPRLAGAARRTAWRRGLPASTARGDTPGTRARRPRGAAAHASWELLSVSEET